MTDVVSKTQNTEKQYHAISLALPPDTQYGIEAMPVAGCSSRPPVEKEYDDGYSKTTTSAITTSIVAGTETAVHQNRNKPLDTYDNGIATIIHSTKDDYTLAHTTNPIIANTKERNPSILISRFESSIHDEGGIRRESVFTATAVDHSTDINQGSVCFVSRIPDNVAMPYFPHVFLYLVYMWCLMSSGFFLQIFMNRAGATSSIPLLLAMAQFFLIVGVLVKTGPSIICQITPRLMCYVSIISVFGVGADMATAYSLRYIPLYVYTSLTYVTITFASILSKFILHRKFSYLQCMILIVLNLCIAGLVVGKIQSNASLTSTIYGICCVQAANIQNVIYYVLLEKACLDSRNRNLMHVWTSIGQCLFYISIFLANVSFSDIVHGSVSATFRTWIMFATAGSIAMQYYSGNTCIMITSAVRTDGARILASIAMYVTLYILGVEYMPPITIILIVVIILLIVIFRKLS
jgi:hypothetical protein